jgi:6-phosphogluconolactonase (cycloisomerase 2 family)
LTASPGKTSWPILAAESTNPAFLAVHPKRRFLYAANENPIGMVSAFSIASSSDAGRGGWRS